MITPLVGAEYKDVLIREIESAKKNIDIAMFEWRYYMDDLSHPVQEINLALHRAVRRGVFIRAILDKPLILQELVGIGIKAKVSKTRRTLHSKLVIIDSEILLIGSHNLTKNALTSNLETSVMIKDAVSVERFAQFFEHLYF